MAGDQISGNPDLQYITCSVLYLVHITFILLPVIITSKLLASVPVTTGVHTCIQVQYRTYICTTHYTLLYTHTCTYMYVLVCGTHTYIRLIIHK